MIKNSRNTPEYEIQKSSTDDNDNVDGQKANKHDTAIKLIKS